MKLSWLALILLYPALLAAEIQLDLKTVAEEKWSPQELELVKKASQIVFNRIASSGVANCSYRNSFRENKDQLRKRWGSQIPVLNKSQKASITIRKKPIERKILGFAKVGTASIDRSQYRILNLEVFLNENNLLKANSVKITGSATALESWVNVIAHEIAHNLGYRHGNKGQWSTDYPGYFPTELGFCTMTSGKYGSDLGDLKKRRQRQKLR